MVEGDISKKDYKNKHNFFQKRSTDYFIQNVFTQIKDQYKKETYLNLLRYVNGIAITNLGFPHIIWQVTRPNVINFLMT